MILFLSAVAIIAVIVIAAFVYDRRRPDLPTVPMRNIPAIVAALQARGREGATAWFGVTAPGKVASDATVTELQYRMIGGRLVFDWALLFQPNIDARARVADLLRRRGHTVEETEFEDIDCLRVADGDLPGLAAAILRELFGFGDDAPVRFFHAGFDGVDGLLNPPPKPL